MTYKISKIIILILFAIPVISFGATETQEQTTGSDWQNTYSTYRTAQSFIFTNTVKLNSLKMKLYRYGNPGDYYFKIYETDGNGCPTGDALESQTLNAGELTTSPVETTINYSGNTELSADTKYAVEITGPTGDTNNQMRFIQIFQNGTDLYTSGSPCTYSGSWSLYGYDYSDFVFTLTGTIQEEEEETPVATTTVATTTAQQDAGGVAFGLAILNTFVFLGFCGYIFNRISSKKPWK